VARIIEEGSRLAGDQKKLTTRFGEITDLVRESAHQLPEGGVDGQAVITAREVNEALQERDRRNNRPHREILELIERGVLSFEPRGEVVGQLHGIGLIQISDEAFGRPIRVMSSAYLGTEGVINIEREARMSGRIHSKGFLVLSGYFGKHFAQSTPLIFSANLSFDQLYEEVEGDSASVAELFALMSAVSGIPLRQDLAVTGALNQEGFVLPVGGVTEKVEGVFQACRRVGMSGSQGVILPRRNVENLVLRRDIRDAVDDGRFHVYAIDRVEEGWPILSGREAGEIQEDGTFPEGTVHRAVMDQLAQWARDWRGKREGVRKKGGEGKETTGKV
jgi:predicted ATP-dependent protease